jgi:2,3-bisphosphoglycerate-independent phosphoglycerate mutase
VPLVLTLEGVALQDGGTLADLVPTCLDLLGLEKPAAMSGRSLVTKN